MSLESSELHKQVFGESDDDDLSDLGEVDFSEDGKLFAYCACLYFK